MAARSILPSSARAPRLYAQCAAASLSLSLAACGSLMSPQIFSPTLTGGRGAVDGQAPVPVVKAPASWVEPTVEEAVQRAIALQGQYATAVAEHSEVQPGVGTALVALGATSLFKGVTGGNAKDLAGAGVLGSAGYLWGSNLASPQRQRVYLEGIRALGCAINATRPWSLTSTEAAQMTKDLNRATEAAASLRQLLESRKAANQPIDLELAQPGRAEPTGCVQLRKLQCPTDASAGAAGKNWKSECDSWLAQARRLCNRVPETKSVVRLEPAPSTVQAFQAAQSALAEGDRRVQVLTTAASVQRRAGGLLWSKTDDISARVSEEVLKTEPSLQAVQGSLGNLREVGFRLSGGTLLAPAPGVAQAMITGKPAQRLIQDPVDTRDIDDARGQLLAAVARLEPWIGRLEVAARTGAAQLDACQVQVTTTSLQVDPDDTDISLGKGQQVVFYVSGGTGMPVGTVSGRGRGVPADLVRELDAQGRFRFTLKVRDNADVGDQALVRFTDAAGLSAPRISVRIVKVESSAGGVVADSAIRAAKAAPEADWKLLGFKAKTEARANDFVTTAANCAARIGSDTGSDGKLSESLRDAFRNGSCDPVASP